MSERAVEGVRLLRAVFYAQRQYDAWQSKQDWRDPYIVEQMYRAEDALNAAKAALNAFMGADPAEDFKLKQAGDR